jgi:hypothetical protein
VAFDSVPELLAAIGALPAPQREAARARVAAALEGPAPAARAALGLLALDLAGRTTPGGPVAGDRTPTATTTQPHADRVLVLPELDRLGA